MNAISFQWYCFKNRDRRMKLKMKSINSLILFRMGDPRTQYASEIRHHGPATFSLPRSCSISELSRKRTPCVGITCSLDDGILSRKGGRGRGRRQGRGGGRRRIGGKGRVGGGGRGRRGVVAYLKVTFVIPLKFSVQRLTHIYRCFHRRT